MQVIFKDGAKEKISNAEKLVVELGCGTNPLTTDSIKIDNFNSESVDIIADLNNGIPLDDESVDELHSYHFLEHVENFEFILSEIHRVLKPNGMTIGSVPHFSNPYFYSDYTHKYFFGLYSFSYFDNVQTMFKRKCPTFYSKSLFSPCSIKLIFKSPFHGRYFFKKFFQLLVNLSRYTKEFYEENLAYIFPAYEIYFELRKKK